MKLIEAHANAKENEKLTCTIGNETITSCEKQDINHFDMGVRFALSDQWQIIPAEPKVLTSMEAYKKRYIHPAKTLKEESVHFCWFDSGFDEGKPQGRLERDIELREGLSSITDISIKLYEMYGLDHWAVIELTEILRNLKPLNPK